MAVMIMPRLGETVVEGTIIRWLKSEGDMVAKDELIVEISTDKVDSELPSPAAGRLAKILVRENETVAVDTEIAVIEEVGAATGKEEELVVDPAIATTSKRQTEIDTATDDAGATTSEARKFYTPLVRKTARDLGVNPDSITGTGTGGRVTRDDVRRSASAEKVEAPPAGVVAAPMASKAGAETAITSGERRVPLSHMRRAIARHMVESRHNAAHVTAIIEVDMENIDRLRKRAKERFKTENGFSLTYMPFVAKATVDALMQFPEINSTLDGDELILKKDVNLGIAIALDDGLIVPVIKHAEAMSLIGLAKSISDIAIKARQSRLAPDDVHGGTFTITNPGSLGSIIQTPIINFPEVAILSLERIEKRPVVIADAIAIRSMVYLPLSYDHRVIDGATAARFLSVIKNYLETWEFAPELGLDK